MRGIAAPAMDDLWAEEVRADGGFSMSGNAGDDGTVKEGAGGNSDEGGLDIPVLVVAEGLSMCLSGAEVGQILSVVDRHFAHATVFMEILSPRFVRRDIEQSISQSGATFTWGARSGQELARLCPAFAWEGDHSLVEGMEQIMPVFKVIGKIGPIRDISNTIAVLRK